MTEISEEFTGKTGQEKGNTYEAACMLHKDQIEVLVPKLLKDLGEHGLNQWSMLEILDKVRKQVEDSLGTTVDPENVDVVEEEKKTQRFILGNPR